MLCAPGILLWAINDYKFKRDRKALLHLFVNTWTGKNVLSAGSFSIVSSADFLRDVPFTPSA